MRNGIRYDFVLGTALLLDGMDGIPKCSLDHTIVIALIDRTAVPCLLHDNFCSICQSRLGSLGGVSGVR